MDLRLFLSMRHLVGVVSYFDKVYVIFHSDHQNDFIALRVIFNWHNQFNLGIGPMIACTSEFFMPIKNELLKVIGRKYLC